MAVNLYVTTQFADSRLEETFKAVWPMVIAMLVVLIMVAALPALSLYIPKCFGLM